jgi:hypothetical protein
MPDTIGRVTVPAVMNSGRTFPLTTRCPFGFSVERPVIVHRFGSLDAKQEQRYYVGIGPRKFQFKHPNLNWAETNQLKAFWESMQGPWQAFTYTVPNADASFRSYQSPPTRCVLSHFQRGKPRTLHSAIMAYFEEASNLPLSRVRLRTDYLCHKTRCVFSLCKLPSLFRTSRMEARQVKWPGRK